MLVCLGDFLLSWAVFLIYKMIGLIQVRNSLPQVWGWLVGAEHSHIFLNCFPLFACFRHLKKCNILNITNTLAIKNNAIVQ